MNITFQMLEKGNVFDVWAFQPLRVNIQSFESCHVLELISANEMEKDISGFVDFFYEKRFCCNPNFKMIVERDAPDETTVLSPVFFMLSLNPSTTICAGTVLKITETEEESKITSYSPEEIEFFSRFEEEARE